MLEYKISNLAKVPVRLLDSGGSAVTGVTSGSVTATVMKFDGSTEAVTVSGAWNEISTGAFASEGMYTLTLSAANLNTSGLLSYAVKVSGAKTYVGIIKVVSAEEYDTYARVGSPIGASISADLQAVQADIDTVDSDIGSVATSISTLTTNVNTLSTTVSGVDTNVDSIITTLGTITTTLGDLETSIDDLEVTIEDAGLDGFSDDILSIRTNVSLIKETIINGTSKFIVLVPR
jgi:hypothetical protein